MGELLKINVIFSDCQKPTSDVVLRRNRLLVSAGDGGVSGFGFDMTQYRECTWT